MWRPVVLWAPARCLSFLVRPVVFKTLLGGIFDRRSFRLLGYRGEYFLCTLRTMLTHLAPVSTS